MPIYVSHEELENAVATVRRHPTYQAAADALGIPVTTLKSRLKIASRRGLDLSVPPEGFEVASVVVREKDGQETGRTVHARPEREPYGVREGHTIKAESALLDADGRLVQRWIKTREDADFAQAFLDVLDGLDIKPVAPVEPPATPDSELLTLYPIADAHVGQLSWGKETGEDYDLHAARRIVTETAGHLIGLSPSSGTAVVMFLGDFFHANDPTNTTPASKHPLDVDGRHVKVIDAAIEIACAVVSMAAARHRDVVVRVLPGNHDPDISPWLARVIKAAFREDPRIQVDTAPGLFWFMEWGRTLLGATHGHTIKQKEMPLAMAASVPEAWGKSRFRLFVSGHIHHSEMIEAGGVICRAFPALGARDAYAASRGLFAHRGMVALTFHKHDGPCGEVARYLPTARLEMTA